MERHPAGCALCLGGVSLPYTWQQLSDLYRPGAVIFGYSEVSAICPALRKWCPLAVMSELQSARPECRRGKLICYTDGSYTPPGFSAAACGWACVFFDPAERTLGFLYGAFPTFLVAATLCSSPFQGEVAGLLAAALAATAAFSDRDILFLSDCTAALGIAAGTHVYEAGTLSQAMRHAHQFRHTAVGRRDTYDHVRAHQGHVGNEMADVLSKMAAAKAVASCGLQAAQPTIATWLSDGAPYLPWAGSVVRQLGGDLTLPPPVSVNLADDTQHRGLSACQLLEPFLPQGAFAVTGPSAQRQLSHSVPGSKASVGVLYLAVATFNTLSLGPMAESDEGYLPRAEGLAYRPGRAPLLAAQLTEHGVQAVCLQETRAAPHFSRVGGFLRYASGAERGQWGTEWWFLDHHDLFQMSSNAAKISFQAQSFAVVHSDPRRLFIRFAHHPLKLLFIGLHAPHRATEKGIIEQWWRETRRLVRVHRQDDLVLLAGDCNASLGSVPSELIGTLGAEEEDLAGTHLHSLLQYIDCCVPATMPDHHSGATHTYTQKRGGHLSRIDYVCVPRLWLRGACRSTPLPGLHAARGCPDHVATGIWLSLPFQCASLRTPLRKRSFRVADVLAPEHAPAIEQALASVPSIPWTTSSHAHAAILVAHVQGILLYVDPKRSDRTILICSLLPGSFSSKWQLLAAPCTDYSTGCAPSTWLSALMPGVLGMPMALQGQMGCGGGRQTSLLRRIMLSCVSGVPSCAACVGMTEHATSVAWQTRSPKAPPPRFSASSMPCWGIGARSRSALSRYQP